METPSLPISLPKEVRQIILRILLVPQRILSPPISLFTDQDQIALGQVSWKVLLTCKLIYEECVPVLYGENIFNLDDSDGSLWSLLHSAGERNISMIRRVGLRMQESGVDRRPWSFVARALKRFCELAPGFPTLRPINIIVNGLGPDWHILNEGLSRRGYDRLRGVQDLFDEMARSVWEPMLNGRSVDEREALNARIGETLSRIDACNLHDTILATAIDLENLGLNHLHLASAEGGSRGLQEGTERVLVLSSKSEAPYHLSNGFFVLICRLKVDIERKRVEVLEEYDHHSQELSKELQFMVDEGEN